jgi:hypothetical protein
LSPEVIDAYGRELSRPDDILMVNRIVSLRFDAEGRMIFYTEWPENQSYVSHRRGPEGSVRASHEARRVDLLGEACLRKVLVAAAMARAL